MRGKGLFIAAGVFLVLALFTKLCLMGYGMTAVCFAGLAAILAFYGFLRRRGGRPAKTAGILTAAVLAAGFALFLAAEIPVVRDARSDENVDAPYIIVLGAAVHGSTPSLAMAERADAALQWLREHPEGVAVVSGGQGPGEDITEADAMALYLTERGVAPARILREPEATTSYENLLFSLRVIEAHGGDPTGRVAVCSSEYHLHRARYIAERLGCEPVGVAARTGVLPLRLNYYVREGLAMWKCRLFGVE